MPPIRIGDTGVEGVTFDKSSPKYVLDELPVDAWALSPSHGDQDKDHDDVSIPPRHLPLSAGSSKENIIVIPAKGRGKSKPHNPASQSLPKCIALKGVQLRPTVVFDTFWRFAAERKAIDDRRRAGLPQP